VGSSHERWCRRLTRLREITPAGAPLALAPRAFEARVAGWFDEGRYAALHITTTEPGLSLGVSLALVDVLDWRLALAPDIARDLTPGAMTAVGLFCTREGGRRGAVVVTGGDPPSICELDLPDRLSYVPPSGAWGVVCRREGTEWRYRSVDFATGEASREFRDVVAFSNEYVVLREGDACSRVPLGPGTLGEPRPLAITWRSRLIPLDGRRLITTRPLALHDFEANVAVPLTYDNAYLAAYFSNFDASSEEGDDAVVFNSFRPSADGSSLLGLDSCGRPFAIALPPAARWPAGGHHESRHVHNAWHPFADVALVASDDNAPPDGPTFEVRAAADGALICRIIGNLLPIGWTPDGLAALAFDQDADGVRLFRVDESG
jgi:hypothetical protein